jgi:DNA polymerase III delta subunit
MVKRGSGLAFDPAELLLAGDSSGLPPLTLASGADEYLRGRLVAAFRVGAEGEGAELRRLEGDDLDAEKLAGALASISLFSTSLRVWIREGSKLDKASEEVLLAWARGSAEGTRVLVTTARDVAELRGLQAIASVGVTVSCAPPRPAESATWVERMIADAGLRLPPGAAEALAMHARDLLEARQEVEKLRAHADESGRVPPRALDALRGARAGASLDRWADAVLAGDVVNARREAAALDAEGVGGTNALWAVAERALAALEPQSFGYRRGPVSRTRLTPSQARAALHAVYAADRALKRGELRDSQLRDWMERKILESGNAPASHEPAGARGGSRSHA